uniref:uncharacterized protein isoform X2 n=1 Tax=Myxine glutinosa TaxID=7769 RepID=UPI00358F99B3
MKCASWIIVLLLFVLSTITIFHPMFHHGRGDIFKEKVLSVEPQDIPRSLCKTICNILLPSFLKETVPAVPQKIKGVFSYLYNGIFVIIPTSFLKKVVSVEPQDISRSLCETICNIVPTSFLKETVPSVPQKIIGVFRYLYNGIHNIVPTSFLKKPEGNILPTSFLKIEPDTCPWEPSIWSSPKCTPTHWLTPTTEIPGNETACLDDMDVHRNSGVSQIEPDTCPWEPSIWSSPKCAPTHCLTPTTEIPGNETAYLDDMDVHQCLDFISMEDQEEEMVEINIYIYKIILHDFMVCAILWQLAGLFSDL